MALDRARRRIVHATVQKALRAGVLVRSDCCDKCGALPGRRALDGHHHNGYDDEHILDLIWLCEPCHRIMHPARPGMPHPAEVKDRIGVSVRKAYADGRHALPDIAGKQNPFFGKTHSEETRQRLRKPKPRVKCPICTKITSPSYLYRHGCEVPLVAGRRRTESYYVN